MQTLLDMSGERTSMIVFPLPVELLRPMISGLQGGQDTKAADRPRSQQGRAPQG